MLDLVGLDQRVADLAALGRDEREGHRAADEDLVTVVEQCGDHADLVAHLRAAEHADERVLGCVEEGA